MAKHLARAGHEVHIVTSNPQSESSSYEWTVEKIAGFTVHWVAIPYSNKMEFNNRIKSFAKFAFRASVKARKLRGDVVFATSTPLTIAIPGLFASMFRRTPLVFEVRDLWPDVPIAMGALSNPVLRISAQLMERITYVLSHSIVTLSPDMKVGIVGKGVKPEKVTVIPNASDNDFFQGHEESGRQFRQSYEWLKGRKMVLYCGTLGKVNNVQYLVDLAAYVKKIDSEIRFVIVGTGNAEDEVRQRAAEQGVLGVNLYMLPQVPKSEVPPLFAAADVTASTVAPIEALFANSANKFFDSFAAGRPVIINHGGWQARLLAETSAGWVMDETDPASAATHLVDYLHDESALQTGRQAARTLAEESFSRQKLAERLQRVIELAYNDRRSTFK